MVRAISWLTKARRELKYFLWRTFTVLVLLLNTKIEYNEDVIEVFAATKFLTLIEAYY